MKVPADCPGEQTKDEKKKLKAERQAAASAAVEAPASNGVSSPPPLTRQDTMNSLSSGYAASATRSLSGTVPRAMTQDDTTPTTSSPLTSAPSNASSTPTGTARRNRIVAPPPAAYVSGSSAPASNGDSQPKAKMLYPYEAREAGEVTLSEGTEVKILEPDGKTNILDRLLDANNL